MIFKERFLAPDYDTLVQHCLAKGMSECVKTVIAGMHVKTHHAVVMAAVIIATVIKAKIHLSLV
jgi:hypothetical protein